MNNRNLFLSVLEAGKPKTKVAAHLVSGKDQLPCSQVVILLPCHHMAEGMREPSGVPFIRALIPFVRPPSS